MDTYLIRIDDSCGTCDSMCVNLCQKTKLQPIVVNYNKKGDDSGPIVTGLICGTILALSIVAALAFLIWKKREHAFEKEMHTLKTEKEKEDAKNKTDKDLLDHYLDYLKYMATKENPEASDKENYVSAMRGILKERGLLGK